MTGDEQYYKNRKNFFDQAGLLRKTNNELRTATQLYEEAMKVLMAVVLTCGGEIQITRIAAEKVGPNLRLQFGDSTHLENFMVVQVIDISQPEDPA